MAGWRISYLITRFSMVLLSLFACTGAYAEIVIVANSDVVASRLTRDQVRSIYLSDNPRVQGQAVVRFDQAPTSPLYRLFYAQIAHRNPLDIEQYWSHGELEHRQAEPEAITGSQGVLALVAATSAAVGYVDRRDLEVSGLKHSVKELYSVPTKEAGETQSTSRRYLSESTDDLWQAMHSEFQLQSFYGEPAVDHYYRFYSSHPNVVNKAFHNATPYLAYVYQACLRHGVPVEFALLPAVESAYNPYAHSSAGAVGLWQMMPATAKTYQLENSWWYDRRRSIMLSTDAALNYLTRLHLRFHSWLLAAAAYNSGPTVVEHALALAHRQGSDADYWSLSLPAETRSYVPKWLAMALTVDRSVSGQQAGFELPQLNNQLFFSRIALSRQWNVQDITKTCSVSANLFHYLNPGWRRAASQPHHPVSILLPALLANQCREHLLALDHAEHTITWRRHVIEQGQSLSTIAARYHTDVNQLRKMNTLTPGQAPDNENLLVPVGMSLSRSLSVPGHVSSAHPKEEHDRSLHVQGAHTKEVQLKESRSGATHSLVKEKRKLSWFLSMLRYPSLKHYLLHSVKVVASSSHAVHKKSLHAPISPAKEAHLKQLRLGVAHFLVEEKRELSWLPLVLQYPSVQYPSLQYSSLQHYFLHDVEVGKPHSKEAKKKSLRAQAAHLKVAQLAKSSLSSRPALPVMSQPQYAFIKLITLGVPFASTASSLMIPYERAGHPLHHPHQAFHLSWHVKPELSLFRLMLQYPSLQYSSLQHYLLHDVEVGNSYSKETHTKEAHKKLLRAQAAHPKVAHLAELRLASRPTLPVMSQPQYAFLKLITLGGSFASKPLSLVIPYERAGRPLRSPYHALHPLLQEKHKIAWFRSMMQYPSLQYSSLKHYFMHRAKASKELHKKLRLAHLAELRLASRPSLPVMHPPQYAFLKSITLSVPFASTASSLMIPYERAGRPLRSSYHALHPLLQEKHKISWFRSMMQYPSLQYSSLKHYFMHRAKASKELHKKLRRAQVERKKASIPGVTPLAEVSLASLPSLSSISQSRSAFIELIMHQHDGRPQNLSSRQWNIHDVITACGVSGNSFHYLNPLWHHAGAHFDHLMTALLPSLHETQCRDSLLALDYAEHNVTWRDHTKEQAQSFIEIAARRHHEDVNKQLHSHARLLAPSGVASTRIESADSNAVAAHREAKRSARPWVFPTINRPYHAFLRSSTFHFPSVLSLSRSSSIPHARSGRLLHSPHQSWDKKQQQIREASWLRTILLYSPLLH